MNKFRTEGPATAKHHVLLAHGAGAPMTSPFLTTAQAAEYLNVSTKTLEGLRSSGGGPRYRKHGRKVVYQLAQLEEWSEGREVRSTSDSSSRGWA